MTRITSVVSLAILLGISACGTKKPPAAAQPAASPAPAPPPEAAPGATPDAPKAEPPQAPATRRSSDPCSGGEQK